MMTSSNGNIFRVTGPLCVEFTSHLTNTDLDYQEQITIEFKFKYTFVRENEFENFVWYLNLHT